MLTIAGPLKKGPFWKVPFQKKKKERKEKVYPQWNADPKYFKEIPQKKAQLTTISVLQRLSKATIL